MSFPSGHAANSALVYLTIAALASDVEPGRSARSYIMAVAMDSDDPDRIVAALSLRPLA